MPTNSIAFVNDRLLAKSLLNGTGGVGKWRTVTTRLLLAKCIALAPVNNVENAEHRGGVVGTYKDSFHTDNRGTRANRFIGRVTNDAPHAKYVEHGRGESGPGKWQWFSWVKDGGIPQWYAHTGAREGSGVMQAAGQAIAAERHARWDDRTVPDL